jgi:hypothetical protein
MQNIDCLFSRGLIVAVDDVQGTEELAVQQVRADGEPHGPDVLGLPRHDPAQFNSTNEFART